MTAPVPRREDWPHLLEAEFLRQSTLPFEYGRRDCCFAVVECIRRMVGSDSVAADLEAEHLGSLRGSLEMFQKYGGLEGLAELIAGQYGWAEWPTPLRAQRGDVGVVQGDQVDPELGVDRVLGIVHLDGKSVLVANDPGWLAFPLTSLVRAWRINV